ncbi:MAG: leucine-rich repeat protein, partial [Clostridia bacterium]|nr:leucine-rich repeat protein [Clostridia bacterium]
MSKYKFKKCEGPDYLTRDKSFKYSGNADAVIVPDETISITSKSFKILKAIRLGRNVSKVNNNCVECFEVDSSNPFFTAVNGVFYSKNGKTLVAYPSLLNETEYIIPDSVTAINSGAFFHSNLEKVIFNKNIRMIGKEAFSGM